MEYKEGLGWKACRTDGGKCGAEVIDQGSWDLFEITADVFGRLNKHMSCREAEDLIRTGRHLYMHVNDRCGPPYTVVLDDDYAEYCPWMSDSKPAGKRGLFNATVVSLLLFFCLLSLARKMDNPFLAMLVEIIGGVDGAVLNTSYISALAAVGGIISGFLFGALSDRFAPWKLAIPALAAAAGTMFLQAGAHTLWILAAARFFCYFAVGGVEPVAFALRSRSTAAAHRSAVLGWSASVRVLGSLLGAALSGVLISTIHTRGIFCAAGCVMVLLIPFGLLILRPRGDS